MIRKEGQRAWPEKGGQNAMARLVGRRDGQKGWAERDGQRMDGQKDMARIEGPARICQKRIARKGLLERRA